MKLRHFFALTIAAVTMLWACEPTVDEAASISVSSTSLDVDPNGSNDLFVTIVSNCDWTAESNSDWLTINPSTGGASNGGTPMTISVAQNQDGQKRSATISITGTLNGTVANAKISLTQGIVPPSISSSNLSMKMRGQSQAVKFKSFQDWTVETDCDWISLDPVSGKGSPLENYVTISVPENFGESRSGKVTFKTGTNTAVLVVSQKGRPQSTDATVSEFSNAPVGTDKWYRITGVVTMICDNSKDAYGNFYIKDGTGEVFVYGLTYEPASANDKSFSQCGISEGDIVTIVSLRSEYHGKVQAGGTIPAFFEKKEKGTQPVRTYSDFKAPAATANWMELPETSEEDGHDFLHHTMWLGSREVRSYSMYWDYSNMVSRWVAYPLNRELMGYGKRTDKWGLDPLLPRNKQPVVTGAYSTDADGVTYGRGHQIGSADRTNYEANVRTFFGTNMTPQISDFNGAIWANLENTVRLWSKRSTTDTLYVVTGCVVDGSEKYVNDVDGKRVTVPTGYYKALLRLYEGNYNAVGFFFDHKKYPVNKVDKSMAISIDALEELVGENFFVNLPDDIEAAVEAADPAKDDWWWNNMGE